MAEQIKHESLSTQFYEEDHVENIEGLQIFVNKFNYLKSNKLMFTDDQFPPSEKSLFLPDSQRKWKLQMRNIKWLRSSDGVSSYEMFPKNESMTESRTGLGKLITPYDIMQGRVGDCYFLSAMSCLAVYPDRILDLFITRKFNSYGIYCIKLCHDGVWKAIILDDYFPFTRDNQFLFNAPFQNELWGCYLEKAWAKLNKCYEYTESGQPSEAFRTLTGAPTIDIQTKVKVKVNRGYKNEIQYCLLPIMQDIFSVENRFLITASIFRIKNEENQQKYKSLGLVDGHCYSVIKQIYHSIFYSIEKFFAQKNYKSIKQITHPKHGKITLVKLRNPWGSEEWKGKWSRNSNIWTEELRKQLKVKEMSDGTFFMGFKTFCKYFSSTTICYYHDYYVKSSLSVSSSNYKNSQYFRITVSVQGKYYISLIKPNPRATTWNYQYTVSRIYLIKVQDDDFSPTIRYVGGKKGTEFEVFQEFNLEPGVYILQAKIFQESSTAYVISSYGINSTLIEKIDKSEVPQGILKESLVQYARRYCQPTNESIDNNIEYININQNIGYGFYYFQNFSENSYNISIQIPKSVKVKKPSQLKFVSQPGSEEIIVFKRNKPCKLDKKYIEVKKMIIN